MARVNRGAASRGARGEAPPAPGAARKQAKPPSREARAKPGAPSAAPKTKAARGAKAEAKPKTAPRGNARDGGLVAVAEVARPHGVQGELRLKVYNPDSDLLARRPRISLRLPDGTGRDAVLVSAREANKAILVRLAGVDDRDAAEALRGAEICVAREALPPLEEGEFYACDLEGARAVLASGEALGHVSGVTSYPTCDVLVIERAGGARLEVPLLEPYVGNVDAKNGLVEILTIEGLE